MVALYKYIKTYIIIVIALFGLCGFSLKNPVVEKTEKGNQFFQEKKYDDALQEYRNAQVDAPESPYLHFDIGTALIKQKKYDEAITELQKVQLPNDPVTGSKAYYNIGAAQYRQAEAELAKNNLQGAVDKLQQSIDSNIQAMRFNPNDLDSKYNIEQARKKMKEILDEIKKQQEKQQNQKQDKQQQQNQQEQQKQQGEQNKQEQQKQQEEQAKQSDEKDKNKEQQAGQQQQQVKEGKMSKEDAERILNSLPDEERKSAQEYMRRQYGGDVQNMKNDW